MGIFITRPIMALAFNLVLVLAGVIAMKHIPLKHKAEAPNYQVTLYTPYPGANYKVVENKITNPLEDAIKDLDGVKTYTSKTSDGESNINLKLDPAKDYEYTISKIKEKLNEVAPYFPKESGKPMLFEQGEQENIILYLQVIDKKQSPGKVHDYLKNYILEDIKRIEGVSKAKTWGSSLFEVVVELDPVQLSQLGLTASTVLHTISKEKTFATAGTVESLTGKKDLVLDASFAEITDLRKISIINNKNKIYKLEDIAEIKVKQTIPEFTMRTDGEESVIIAVSTKANANPLIVSKEVKKYIEKSIKYLPGSMSIKVIADTTQAFSKGINEVYSSLIEAIILVGIIVVLSLASFRAASIPMVTIPLCLLSNFTVVWLLGFSINPVTLLAMILAVGLVVDDAIVVVENIHKHMAKGLSAIEAAKAGMKEITFAVIVMTITLVAVYLPFAFQRDASSYLLREFSFTLAGSVLLSGFVALTLTPAMCSKLLVKSSSTTDISYKAEIIWDTFSNNYVRLLKRCLGNPKKIISGLSLVLFLIYLGFKLVPSIYQPVEDENLVQGWFSYKNSVTNQVKQGWFEDLEKIVTEHIPEKEHMFIGKYNDNLFWFTKLIDRNERKQNSWDIAKRLNDPLKKIYGPQIGVDLSGSANGQDSSTNFSIFVKYAGDINLLLSKTQDMINEINKLDSVNRAFSQELEKKDRYKITVLREIAAELGVSVQDIEDTLYVLLSGKKAFDLMFDNHEYKVKVRARDEFRQDLSNINSFFVQSNTGASVPLGTLISIEEDWNYTFIGHHNGVQTAKIKISLKPDVNFDQSLVLIDSIISKYSPNGSQIVLSGGIEEYKIAKINMIVTVVLSIIFIFLVLSALFESFLMPFIVLLTVPLSVLGAIWMIYFVNGTNNMYTQIGIITLIGLITKHGILITDFANRLIYQGISINEAIVTAAKLRLRPIIMTTLAMIFGAVPLVMSIGFGANARSHLGWTIIGGMLTGTIFSLFLIPVAYKLLAKNNIKHG